MFENLNLFIKDKKDKDVYDVINSRANKNSKELLLGIPKLASVVVRITKLKSEGKDTSVVERDLLDVVKKFLPAFIDSAHYSYEIYKEIEYNYGNEKLLEYVQRNGKDPIEFAYNYNRTREMMLKMLSLFAVLKNEGMTLNDFNDPSIALRIMNGESEMKIIEDRFSNLSLKVQDEIEEILDKETKYDELDPEIHSIVDKYHFEYMTNNVYPYVMDNNSNSKNEERVLKLASKLGNKRRNSFVK